MKPCKLCRTPTAETCQICGPCQAGMPICSKCGSELNDKGSCPTCASNSAYSASKRGKSSSGGYSSSDWLSAFIAGLLFLGFLFYMGSDDSEPLTDAERRIERIERQFSAWDGSHYNLERTIKAAMNDPDSYEHVNTGYVDDGDSLRVQTTYRGRNALGGVVTERVTARVSMSGEVLEILEQ